MTQLEYKSKAQHIAEQLGFEILIEDNVVYLSSDEVKSEFLRVKHPNQTWRLIFMELTRWGEGCNLISPIANNR